VTQQFIILIISLHKKNKIKIVKNCNYFLVFGKSIRLGAKRQDLYKKALPFDVYYFLNKKMI
jgi:hypothetical protein